MMIGVPSTSRVAIIGSGISGLGCAYFLRQTHDVTVFEQDARLGGHANTVEAIDPISGSTWPIDTGFMVFNKVTYPLLTSLFEELKVPIKPTSMSFGVRDDRTGLEWCGTSLNHLFAQRRNVFNWRFIRMLRQVDRFNREAVSALHDPTTETLNLSEYLKRGGYGADFFELYLGPMSSAVWSTPLEMMLQFPASTLLRFFFNHGFLGLHSQHPWWTVQGGSREYVSRLTATLGGRIRSDCGVRRIRRTTEGVVVQLRSGEERTFDFAIVAAHADQALQLLERPTPNEARVLGAFRYQSNVATLHTDTSVMPRVAKAWASWNCRIAQSPDGTLAPATHYWMNQLQGIASRESYFVTINRPELIDEKKVIRRIAYAHPLFDLSAKHAQTLLPRLNAEAASTTRTFFVGAYQRYGFHEDGLKSAHDLCAMFHTRQKAPAVVAN